MYTYSILFLNLGTSEIILIVLVFLLFFGAKSIPSLARGLGKGMREFKDATNSIQEEIRNSAVDIRDDLNVAGDLKQEIGKIDDVVSSAKREKDNQ